MEGPDRAGSEDAELQNHNAYQVYHKEGLLSQQSSVVPNAPLLYEQQVLMSKLRQGGSGSGSTNTASEKMHRQPSPPSPDAKFVHPDDFPHDSSQELDDSKSEVWVYCFFRYLNSVNVCNVFCYYYYYPFNHEK